MNLVPETIVGKILVIASFAIIILVIAGSITPLYGETSEKSVCQASVSARAGVLGSSLLTKQLITAPNLNCKTQYKCLSLGGKCPSGYDYVGIKTAEDIKFQLAEEMRKCWDEMGRGKIDFVGKELLRTNACTICSQIRFDDASIKNIKTVQGLNDYLSKTKMPRGNVTYAQYLSNDPAASAKSLGEDRTIDLSKEYAVNYVIFTKEYLTSSVYTASGAIIGGIVGSVVPGAGNYAGILIGGSIGTYFGNQAGDWVSAFFGGETMFYSANLKEYNTQEMSKACPIIMSTP